MAMGRKKLFIANLKMYLSHAEEIAYLKTLPTPKSDDTLVVMPSALTIATKPEWQPHNIALGAQVCSPFPSGPFTGQVRATDLAALGCRFCLIGHSEQRTIDNDIDLLGKQTHQVVLAGMIPVICLGFGAEEHEGTSIADSLIEEMTTLLAHGLQGISLFPSEIIIAYEPTWAIGTGSTPSLVHIDDIATKLQRAANQLISHPTRTLVLYGGSVNKENARDIVALPGIDGVLIGKASVNGKELENILE